MYCSGVQEDHGPRVWGGWGTDTSSEVTACWCRYATRAALFTVIDRAGHHAHTVQWLWHSNDT